MAEEENIQRKTLELTFPVFLIPSYLFTSSMALSEYLGLPLTRYQRDTKLNAGVIYESDSCPETLIKSREILFIFVQWDDDSKSLYLERVKTMQKAELPASLMKYCKKTGADAIPYIEKVFSDMQKVINRLKEEQPEFVIHLAENNPEKIFIHVKSALQSVKFSDSLIGKLENLTLDSLSKSENSPKMLEKIDKEEKKSVPYNNAQSICIILVVFGIPGMGKSYLTPYIRTAAINNEFEFFVLSSDEIRNSCMLGYQRKHPLEDQKKAFEKSYKTSNKQFTQELLLKIRSNSRNLLIFLDKNHTPPAFDKLHQQLTKAKFKNTSIRIVSLSPKTSSPISFPEKKFPFSLEFLLLCVKRCLVREPHLTLTGDKAKIASVVLMIFTYFSGFDLEKTGDIHEFIQVPFLNEEGSRTRISDHLRNSVLEKLRLLSSELEIDPELEGIADQVLEIDFELFDVADLVQQAISGVLEPFRLTQRPPAAKANAKEEEKSKKNKGKKKGKEGYEKSPLYIGIKTEKSIRPIVLDFMIENLQKIFEFYQNPAILKDIQQIENFKQGKPSTWRYPMSYHLTTMFIGRSGEKYKSSQFQDFKCELKTTLKITHFVYSPSFISCGKAEVVSPYIEVENKLPHITLLLGTKPAVYSNTVLQYVDLSQDSFCTTFSDQGVNSLVYSFKLPEPMVVIGKTAYFY